MNFAELIRERYLDLELFMPASTVQEAKSKIRQVFRFLAEFQKMRTPPARRLAEYDWHLFFADLPNDPCIEMGQFVAGSSAHPEGELKAGPRFILRVRRPKETACPPPPEILRDWVVTGWQNIDGEITTLDVRNRVVDGKTTTERFMENAARTRALEAWRDKRFAWIKAERPIREAMRIFRRLFELRGRLEREAEKFQLVLGDGLLSTLDTNGQINHPLLLQSVELQFDERIPAFTIVETDDAPELNTGLLGSLTGIDGSRVGACWKDLDQQAYHPLGGQDTDGYLSRLVHSLFVNGRFEPANRVPAKTDSPLVYRKAVLYLAPRGAGVARAIDGFLKRLDECSDVCDLPAAITRVVGIDLTATAQHSDSAPTPAATHFDVDLLLTKPANPEQERVIQRLSSTSTVLVQGPPGTGKTHTIANLIGHLLAQGKSILVTSHTAKALRVVRQSVVEELRPLCVSVLDTDARSRSELEQSVQGIATRLSTSDLQQLEREANELQKVRESLKIRITELRKKLERAIKDEYDSIVVGGESTAPAIAARRVQEGIGKNDWIPGPVLPGAPLPHSLSVFDELYKLNELLPVADENDLRGRFPSLANLPSVDDFATLSTRVRHLESMNLSSDEQVWPIIDPLTAQDLSILRHEVLSAIAVLDSPDRWYGECLEAGLFGGDYRKPWEDLVAQIDDSRRRIAEWSALVTTRGPRIDAVASSADPKRTCEEILKRLRQGKTLGGWFSAFANAEWDKLVSAATVDGKQPQSLDDFEALHALLALRDERDQLRRRWDRQVGPLGNAVPELSRDAPEDYCVQFLAKIREGLAWHEQTWGTCQERFRAIGICWSLLRDRVPPVTGACPALQGLQKAVQAHLLPMIERRGLLMELIQKRSEHTSILRALQSIKADEDPGRVVAPLREAVSRLDAPAYDQAWSRLSILTRQRERLHRRTALLSAVQKCASGWAAAIQHRTSPHDSRRVPGDVQKAWLHRQWAQEIERRATIDIDSVQQELSTVKERLQDATSKFVNCRTWAAQRRRIGLAQQLALVGWLDLVRKPGFASGVRSATLKAAARKRLAECRAAVPVWIMPLSRAADCYDFRSTQFDVVIIDEASQSDVTGLLAFALGREIVVVGDHEQVSPLAAFQNLTQVQALIDQHLEGIPDKELYDGRRSIYDLARGSFGDTIRLVEHFRCVPEIIQFSNHLSYAGEIKPLRDSSSVKTRPFVLAHRVVDGCVEKKVNQAEAEELASLLVAATEQPEYSGLTMGVICMVGYEQALEIDKLLQRHLAEADYASRRIVCGNPGQFQGDERDVVFISVIDSSPTGKPLSLRQGDDFKRRFNVAASRAKDQLWVVHSLDTRTDLQNGDLRLRLIQHANDPSALAREMHRESQRADNEFERQVLKHLIHKLYRARAQWPVGAYKIDIVVLGQDGRKAAIECDGDTYHTPDNLHEDMDRQMLMERLGWRFIRIRSTRFFSDTEATMARVYQRLEELGIEPIGAEIGSTETAGDNGELRERVIRRAQELRQAWREEEQGIIKEQPPKRAPEDVRTAGVDPEQGLLPFPSPQVDAPRSLRVKENDQPKPTLEPVAAKVAANLAPDGKPWEYLENGYWWQWFPSNGRRTRGRKA